LTTREVKNEEVIALQITRGEEPNFPIQNDGWHRERP